MCVIFFDGSVIPSLSTLHWFHFLILFFSLPPLLADVVPSPCDLRSYEFEFGDPSSGGQTMGSLQQFVAFWESIGSSKMVLDWVRFGVPIRWKDGPVEHRVMRNARSALGNIRISLTQL